MNNASLKSITLKTLALLAVLAWTGTAPAQVNQDWQPPGFAVTLADGSTLRYPEDLDRPTIVLFWATWCPYCKALMPHLQSILDQHPGEVQVLALAIRDDGDPAATLAEYGYDFRLAPAADAVAEAWGVKGVPGLFLARADGRVVFDRMRVPPRRQADSPEAEAAMKHYQKAARQAPYWAAQLRVALQESGVPAQAAAGAGKQEMDSLVSAEWLSRHLDDPDLVVLDCSVMVEQDEQGALKMVNGRANYEAGHIPGAGFADLMGALSDADSPLEFGLPSPEAFVAAMRELGVGDDSRVVLYDANLSVWAARVWWMLRWAGFDRAALLDGGLRAWTEAGHPLSTEPVDRPAGRLTLNLRPEMIADGGEVLAGLDRPDVRLVDAMPAAHYRGEFAMYARPGHIPGAESLPSSTLLDEAGRFRSWDELDMMIEGDRADRTITYCGGGIAAAADAFVLTRLGFTDVAVYAASLEEWAADPAKPMATAPAGGD